MFAFVMRACGRALGLIAVAAFASVVAISNGVASTDPGVFIPVTSANGSTVHIYAEEYGHGRPILLLHGLGASSYAWRHLIPELSRRHRVVAIDLKGFGRSEKPFDTNYSLIDHAELVTAFIRRTRLRDITLVGHSYGGAVALVVAQHLNRQAPGKLRNLVVMGAPAFPQKPTAFVSFMGTPVVPYAVLSIVPPELSAWLSLSPQERQNFSYEDVVAYARPYWQASARHALISTARQIVPDNLPQLLNGYRHIHQPTLVVWCRSDTTVPLSTGRKLVRTLPNARLRLVEGCAHAPQDEQPDRLLSILAPFIDRG